MAVWICGPEEGVEIDSSVLWNCLACDSGARVALITRSGTYAYMNSETARLFGLDEPLLPGRGTVMDTIAGPVATELLSHIRAVLDSGETRRVDFVLNAQRCRATIATTEMEFQDERCVLVVGARSYVGNPVSEERPVLPSRAEDQGPLEVLTPREREILGLIGLGMTSAEIADRLGRSVKTVEWHRVSIGQKLGGRGRVALAQLALVCGLCAPPSPSDLLSTEERETQQPSRA